MKPKPNKKPDKAHEVTPTDATSAEATPLEIAQLAALIDPQACRSGNFRNALLMAVALFEDSKDVCGMLAAAVNDSLGLDELLSFGPLCGSEGAERLVNLYRQRAINAAKPVLMLDTDAHTDACREYLAKNLNLEGKKKQQQPWKNARTVLDNLKQMYVDRANMLNQHNAHRIAERERLDAEATRERGRAAEKGRSLEWINFEEMWQDGVENFDDFLTECKIAFLRRSKGPSDSKAECYDIPKGVIDALIAWKRQKRRRRDGRGSVRQLTREEVLSPAVKKNIPKKAK